MMKTFAWGNSFRGKAIGASRRCKRAGSGITPMRTGRLNRLRNFRVASKRRNCYRDFLVRCRSRDASRDRPSGNGTVTKMKLQQEAAIGPLKLRIVADDDRCRYGEGVAQRFLSAFLGVKRCAKACNSAVD
jgi:hypothetical protein